MSKQILLSSGIAAIHWAPSTNTCTNTVGREKTAQEAVHRYIETFTSLSESPFFPHTEVVIIPPSDTTSLSPVLSITGPYSELLVFQFFSYFLPKVARQRRFFFPLPGFFFPLTASSCHIRASSNMLHSVYFLSFFFSLHYTAVRISRSRRCRSCNRLYLKNERDGFEAFGDSCGCLQRSSQRFKINLYFFKNEIVQL